MSGPRGGGPWAPFRWCLVRGTGFPLEALARLGGDGGDVTSEAAIARARAALAELAATPAFREAVFLSNPGLDAHLDAYLASLAGPRDATARKRERALLRYAQRICAKNDSTSFFGAVAAATLDAPPPSGPLPVVTARRTFVTQWAAQALMDAARRELGDAPTTARPRRAPGTIAYDGAAVRVKLGAKAALDVIGEVDGEAAGRALAAATGEGAGAGAAEALAAAGLLAPWSELPTGAAEPLEHARGRLLALPPSEARSRWLGRVDGLEAHRGAFAATAGDLPARRRALARAEADFAAWTGAEARRKAGSFYASRGIFQEMGDRTGAPMGLPPGVAEALPAALGPYLELGLFEAAASRLRMRAWFDRAVGGVGTRAPWRAVTAGFHADRVGVELATPPGARELRRLAHVVRDAARAAIDAHLERHGRDVPCELDPALAADALAAAAPLFDEAGVAFANPDVMLLRRADGGLRPLLAEAHHLPFLTPCLLVSLREQGAITEATAASLRELSAGATPALVTSYAHSFISVGVDLGEIALELSGLSPNPPERRASFAELEVERTADGFRVLATTHTGELVPIAPLTRVTRLDLVAPAYPVGALDLPTFLGSEWRYATALPRLAWGELVVHRRRWRVASKRWATEATTEACLRRLTKAVGPAFPRFTFARAESEPKPVLFDWHNPLSVEMAVWQARRDEALVFSELLPGPDDLWLEGPEGAHTAEIRMVWARR